MPSLDDILNHQFGDDRVSNSAALSALTPLTAVKIDELYPNDADKKRVADALKDLRAATDENKRVGKLYEHGETVLDLLRKLGVGV